LERGDMEGERGGEVGLGRRRGGGRGFNVDEALLVDPLEDGGE
jgi:hypothetical protein